MDISELFPVWGKLTQAQKSQLRRTAVSQSLDKGEFLHQGYGPCAGLVLMVSGQLRAYILSEDGREITLYRLLERDICLFSASCVMRNVQFDITIQAEKPSQILVIPPQIYRQLLEESAPVANFSNELMATRFSEVMWLLEQIMWKSVDKRLAGFLLEETSLDGTQVLKLTHESIANHMGTAREVVTRMLRYFQNEGYVKLNRGTVELLDISALRSLSEM